MVLKLHNRSVQHHAQDIRLHTVELGDTWSGLSSRFGIPIAQLRLHNPFLATRRLRTGQLLAYPPAPRPDLLVADGPDLSYRSRFGDNYLHLAMTLDVSRDDMRNANQLWHLGSLPPGTAAPDPDGMDGQPQRASCRGR